MRSWVYLLLTALLLAVVPGCGSDKEKGMNRPDQKRDLPRTAPTDSDK